jgi:hypothetical protein
MFTIKIACSGDGGRVQTSLNITLATAFYKRAFTITK